MALLIVGAGHSAGRALVVSVPPRDPGLIVSLASHEWERLPATAALARQYQSAHVVLTQPAPATEHNCHRCEERREWLERAGVAGHRISVLPDPVANTHDEATASLRFAVAMAPREVLIVTSPYHSRRALATFRHVFGGTGTEIGVFPAFASSPAHPDRWWRFPYDRAYVVYEWTAVLYYTLRFGVMAWGT